MQCKVILRDKIRYWGVICPYLNGSCENTNVTLSHLFIDLKALYVNHKSLQKTEKWDGNDGGKYWIKFIVLLQDYLTRVDALVVKLPPSFNILADDFNLLIICPCTLVHHQLCIMLGGICPSLTTHIFILPCLLTSFLYDVHLQMLFVSKIVSCSAFQTFCPQATAKGKPISWHTCIHNSALTCLIALITL